MDSREALVALNMVEHVGPIRVRQLLEHFGEASAILKASKHQLLHVRSIGEETAQAISNWEKDVDLASELKRIADFGCEIITQADQEYPELLRQIYDPPIDLYVKGKLLPKDKNSVAMVGSRMTTHYGIEAARREHDQPARRVHVPEQPPQRPRLQPARVEGRLPVLAVVAQPQRQLGAGDPGRPCRCSHGCV